MRHNGTEVRRGERTSKMGKEALVVGLTANRVDVEAGIVERLSGQTAAGSDRRPPLFLLVRTALETP